MPGQDEPEQLYTARTEPILAVFAGRSIVVPVTVGMAYWGRLPPPTSIQILVPSDVISVQL